MMHIIVHRLRGSAAMRPVITAGFILSLLVGGGSLPAGSERAAAADQPDGPTSLGIRAASQDAASQATSYLASVMDQYHSQLNVYTDADSAGNAFRYRGRMSSTGAQSTAPPMDEASQEDPHGGMTCIKASFIARGNNWAGWYFMNGVLQGSDLVPTENWGDFPDAGLDLRGATALTFWARGERGGERLELFAFGVGRDADTGRPLMPYPDSSRKVSTGFVTLTTEWQRFQLDLRGKDLSYVLGGFGWTTSAAQTRGQDITFYLDDISYDKPLLDEPRLLRSYQTDPSTSHFDMTMRNTAFLYDNAVALIAFLAAGDTRRAKLIADALVYAQQHDRFYADGGLRNGYAAGRNALAPGWTPNGKVGTIAMPGWTDPATGRWVEDSAVVGRTTGNQAWAMLALLAYYDVDGGSQYLDAARALGDWVERNTRDEQGAGGYTAGFEGPDQNPTKLTYKSTEHNLDLVATFGWLARATGDDAWRERSEHAKRFLLSMWKADEGRFVTGTDATGIARSDEVIPVDVQAWSILALPVDEGRLYARALDYAEARLSVDPGFDFNQDRDGIWWEGTSQMAEVYKWTGQEPKRLALLAALESAQLPSGAMPATDHDQITTGFYLSSGLPWLYYRRAHVGATAWFVLAERARNPFMPAGPG